MPATVEPGVASTGAEVLPGYRVEGLLSRGGRVDTYDVTSLERDCRAVVKVVRPDRLTEEHVRTAVLVEAHRLGGGGAVELHGDVHQPEADGAGPDRACHVDDSVPPRA